MRDDTDPMNAICHLLPIIVTERDLIHSFDIIFRPDPTQRFS
jgi:hypothetical protein